MARHTVVIGLDGAAWHLLDPLLERGIMPRLAALRARGASGVLKSTVPTYTPPAWTSAVTGVNPGRHGIYGFYDGNAQSERQHLMHFGKIRSATLWEMAGAQGARTGVYNLPLTYPPRPLDGWMVSGMMTPGYGERRRGFASWGDASASPELEERILQWAPGYEVDLSANWERDWKDAALCERALATLEQRYRVLEGLLELDPVDIVFAVLETPDRLQHVYYRYLDPGEALYDAPETRAIRPALLRCFEAMDRVVGLLEDYAGPDGAVIVCSDHGFTAWEVSVHTNALLARWGYLELKPRARALQTGAARRLVPLAKRLLPARLARQAKGHTFSAIDWARTKAFASPVPQQGVFVNLRGRERFGIVPAGELAAVKAALAARFRDLTGPDGEPVTDVVYGAEDVFEGHALDGAPDLMPVLRDHRFELDDEVFHRHPFTDLRHLPRGVHHPSGIVVVADPAARRGARVDGSVLDVTPTVLHLAGLGVPEDLDGAALVAAANHPVRTIPPLSSKDRDQSSPYSEDEEALIEESLRGLGYL